MEMISVILLLVVLLAQTVLFVLFFLGKRRSDRKNAAMIAYIDQEVAKFEKERRKDREEILQSVQSAISEYEKKNSQAMDDVNEKLGCLALDYTEAQEAAGKVNTFASSLAHIFDYDPVAASKRNRKKEMG